VNGDNPIAIVAPDVRREKSRRVNPPRHLGGYNAVADSGVKKKRKAGMTLVEVMLALAIAAGGLTLLVAAANKCMAVIQKARIYDDARRLYAEVERKHPLQLEDLEEESDGGTFEGADAQYSWQREVALFTEEEDDGVYRVTTRILWKSRGQDKFEEFSTLLHLPTAKRAGFIDESAVDD
jgi:prepilin-type N-terminal cleavage/methylation domain-containing protein